MEHNGSDTILIAGNPLGAKRLNFLWSHVKVGSVPETIAFYMHSLLSLLTIT